MTYIDGKWRQGLHLEPPRGWLNDPNGLCFFDDFYHVYFQYAPDAADGNGKKCWGHYRSRDLLSWEFTGTVLFPDIVEDKDGVYSGCGVVNDDVLHLFYTGNVKEEGDYDYITSGRGANVIHVTTRDGVTMSEKQIVLRNSDYPDFCSCHVRDPKVWKEKDGWHMVLGARTRADEGCVLFYTSKNLTDWTYQGTDTVPDFGYMWECPDIFSVSDHRFLSVSPQGLVHGETKYQNVYSSGHFDYDDGLKDFTEWDMGFDFYAPQSFETPDGRRILIGWMGIGDIPYKNPTTALGYQHCLTLPREITVGTDSRLLQQPVRELLKLRQEKQVIKAGEKQQVSLPFELTAKTDSPFLIQFEDILQFGWDGHLAELTFTSAATGRGRNVRRAKLEHCTELRLVADQSSVEIYLDGGSCVFSSRMYPETETICMTVKGTEAEIYALQPMQVVCAEEEK